MLSKQRVAFVFSTVGNPLLTSAFLLGAACFRFLSTSGAVLVLVALVLLLLLPIALWNWGRVRSGRYSDFDVSRREDRGTLYRLIVAMTLVAAGGLFITGQPRPLWFGMLCASLMLAVAAGVNRRIKISLHAAFAFFGTVAIARVDTAWVAPTAVFAVLVAWSRFILKRHSVGELTLGTALGLGVGSVLVFALGVMASG
jgi:phosphoglycerol transferase MdoB-like AlkP superfamily enzyme